MTWTKGATSLSASDRLHVAMDRDILAVSLAHEPQPLQYVCKHAASYSALRNWLQCSAAAAPLGGLAGSGGLSWPRGFTGPIVAVVLLSVTV